MNLPKLIEFRLRKSSLLKLYYKKNNCFLFIDSSSIPEVFDCSVLEIVKSINTQDILNGNLDFLFPEKLEFFAVKISERCGSVFYCSPRIRSQIFINLKIDKIIISDTNNFEIKNHSQVFIDFVANERYFGSFDFTPEPIVLNENVFELPRGHVSYFHNNILKSVFKKRNKKYLNLSSFNFHVSKVRESIQKRIYEMCEGKRVGVELSGGIDSGIIASLMKSMEIDVFGISARYNFSEFKRENYFRELLSKYISCSSVELNNVPLPFQPYPVDYWQDTPSLRSSSLYQSNYILDRAYENGAELLFTGHGGDRLFLSPPRKLNNNFSFSKTPSWFSKHAQQKYHDKLFELNIEHDYDSWNEQLFESFWLRINSFTSNIRRESIFSDIDIIDNMRLLWQSAVNEGRLEDCYINKPIANILFSHYLPHELWTRPGKLDHSGLTFRGAFNYGGRYLNLFNQYSDFFDYSLFDYKKLKSQIDDFSKGYCAVDYYLSAFLGFIDWIQCRNIYLPPDQVTSTFSVDRISKDNDFLIC